MDYMEKSSQKYSLHPNYANANKTRYSFEGGVIYDRRTGSIIITYDGNIGNFIHEITHCFQFEVGDIAFHSNSSSLCQDIYDEIKAYKSQFAYNQGFGQIRNVKLKDINKNWLISNCGDIYGPNGTAHTGQIKVRIESKPEVINRAYNVNPPIELNFSTLYGNDFIFKPDFKANRQLYKF